MAIIITEECINCGACEPECPNNAIYEGLEKWTYEKGTNLTGSVVLPNGNKVDSDIENEPISDEVFFIVPNKCTECKGFHEEPQCAAVCPVDCCVPDEKNIESDLYIERKSLIIVSSKCMAGSGEAWSSHEITKFPPCSLRTSMSNFASSPTTRGKLSG